MNAISLARTYIYKVMHFPLFTIVLLCCCLIVAGLTVGHSAFLSRPYPQNGRLTMFNEDQPNPNGRLWAQGPLVQEIQVIVDDPQFGPLARIGDNIVIDGHNASLGQYLWSGRTGSYHEIPGGWPGWKGDVIAKEFYIWFWPHELSRELKYLSRVGQLVASDQYEGIQWLIMHRPPGVHLTKTRAFKEAYQKGRKECDDLVEHAYEPAFNAIVDYIRRYGIYHQVLNSRMLWDDAVTSVSIFDLGDGIEHDPKDADKQDFKNEIALNVYKAWPNDGIYYQDWCVNGQSQ